MRLADHPGGPDNGGDNVAGTAFDDDAPQNISQGTAPYAGPLQAPERPAVAVRRQEPARHLDAARARPGARATPARCASWGVTSQKALCNVDTAAPGDVDHRRPGKPDDADERLSSRSASNDAGATLRVPPRRGGLRALRRLGGVQRAGVGPHTFSAPGDRRVRQRGRDARAYAWSWVTEAPPPAAASRRRRRELRARRRARRALADALAGRYSVLAACASALPGEREAERVAGGTARRLGLGRKAVALGSAAKRRAAGGTATMRVRSARRRARRARGAPLTKATLTRDADGGESRLTLRRTVALRRAARAAADRGPRPAPVGGCSARRSPLSAQLTLVDRPGPPAGPEGHGGQALPAGGRAHHRDRHAQLLTLSVRRRPPQALAHARRVSAMLEAVAGSGAGSDRAAPSSARSCGAERPAAPAAAGRC